MTAAVRALAERSAAGNYTLRLARQSLLVAGFEQPPSPQIAGPDRITGSPLQRTYAGFEAARSPAMPGAFARTPLTSCGAVRYGLETGQLKKTKPVRLARLPPRGTPVSLSLCGGAARWAHGCHILPPEASRPAAALARPVSGATRRLVSHATLTSRCVFALRSTENKDEGGLGQVGLLRGHHHGRCPVHAGPRDAERHAERPDLQAGAV